MHEPSRLGPHLKGEGIKQKKQNTGRLPPLLVLDLGEANIAMVNAAISARQCLLSTPKTLNVSR